MPQRSRACLRSNPELGARLDEPLPARRSGDGAAGGGCKADREMVECCYGPAQTSPEEHCWAGGFTVLERGGPRAMVASFLSGAARCPRFTTLSAWHVRRCAPDGLRRSRRAIHAEAATASCADYAQNVEMADFLVNRGADVDARDVGPRVHRGAGWSAIASRSRAFWWDGGETDILMAAALGDAARVRDSSTPIRPRFARTCPKCSSR